MARKKKLQTLTDAKKLYRLLLWEASGGNLGNEPEKKIKNETMTFAEKRGLLDSIIKISQMEAKSSEGDEEESVLDTIRKNLNVNGTDRGRGDYGRAESGSDDASGSSEEDSGDV